MSRINSNEKELIAKVSIHILCLWHIIIHPFKPWVIDNDLIKTLVHILKFI